MSVSTTVQQPAFALPPGSQVIPPATLNTSATVKIEEAAPVNFKANSIGSFPRVTVPAKSTIPIHLAVLPHEVIQEQVLDGGKLDNDDTAQTQVADDAGNIDFQFQVRQPPGSYRVAIYRQGERQIFDFWVGPDLPARVAQ